MPYFFQKSEKYHIINIGQNYFFDTNKAIPLSGTKMAFFLKFFFILYFVFLYKKTINLITNFDMKKI